MGLAVASPRLPDIDMMNHEFRESTRMGLADASPRLPDADMLNREFRESTRMGLAVASPCLPDAERQSHYHPYAKAGFYTARPVIFWRFSPLRSEAEWERSGRRLDAEIALV